VTIEHVTTVAMAKGKADGLRRAAEIVSGWAQDHLGVSRPVVLALLTIARQLIRESEEAANIVRVEMLPIPGKNVN